jgi:EAL domain-containing protein (putative c-di-GMP-specific phosphodiesterase class I)
LWRRPSSGAVVEPGLLCLEVTESQIMNRPDRALATLNALKAIGVALSIDDFGTGHSSLAYVHELPVSELKIDRSFCMDLDDRNMVVVRAAIEMGHNLA